MNTPFSLTDRYQATAHLARGGMADVYMGKDTLLGRKIAVKVLHSQFSADEAFVKRFRREAQAAANLTHPNIVGIYDWGQFEKTYFIVMELIEGRSLREVLRSEGSLLPRRALEIAAEVAAALSVAHRAGLVHRDIKPGNILLAPDGTVKVTDFGIARAWDDSAELTKTGAVMGTATYFSPEQAQGSPADERSDVYSLGVVLYEMLTGRPPFRGDSPVAVAYQHVSSEVDPPSAVNPDVPKDLDRIVLKAMHKDPASRYQTAEDLRADMWRALRGEPTNTVTADDSTRMMSTPIAPPATVPPAEAYRQLEEPPASNLAFVVGTFALLATLAILVFLVFRLLGGPGSTSGTAAVPAVAGLEEGEALRIVGEAGFIGIPQRESDAGVEVGIVIRTDPDQDAMVAVGSTVLVYVSSGTEKFGVPFLIGLPVADAQSLIETQGFVMGPTTIEENSTEAPGIVISQSVPAGSQAAKGSTISLTVSGGPAQVVLESLDGLTEREAVSKLAQLGLKWDVRSDFDPVVERGRVIRTEPVAGQVLNPGDTVRVFVSDGPEPVDVPSLLGLTQEAAQTRAESLGLVLRVSAATIEVNDPALVGRVVDQFPPAGETLLPGETITITLGVEPPTTTTTTTLPTTTTVP